MKRTTHRSIYRTTLLAAIVSLSTAYTVQAQSGMASYYGGRGSGMTCAHRTAAMGSVLTVSYSGRSIQCRVNDRGPFVRGRIVDLSITAARALGMTRSGVVPVSVY